MLESQRSKYQRTMSMEEAFNNDELSWFAEFERDQEVWKAVDQLFPDEPRIR